MKAFVFLALVASVLSQTCPLNTATPGSTPVARTLSFCPQYNAAACCTNEQDEELRNNTASKIEPLFGSAGCLENIKNLQCAWLCSPNQEDITSITGTGTLSVTVYVQDTWAQDFFDVCQKICVPFGGGVEVSSLFGTPSALVGTFGSANDPRYVPDSTHPNLVYAIGTAPGGNNVNTVDQPIAPAQEADQAGCPDGGDACTLALSAVAVAAAALV